MRPWTRLFPRLPLQVWLVLSHGIALLVPIAVLLGSGELAKDLREQTRWDLEHQGAVLALLLRDRLVVERERDPAAGIASVEGLSPLLAEMKKATLAGIRVTGPDGVVIATSGDLLGEDLARDPEVAAALSGRVGAVIRPRPAPSLRQPINSESRRASVRWFVAVPVQVGDEVAGTIVLSRTPREELQTLAVYMAPGVLAAAIAAGLATVFIAGFAGVVATRSLRLLDRGAERIADGDFGGLADLDRPRHSRLREVARTADAVSTMAERLRDRLAYIAEFASNVSHEFKTPIATLRGTLELLADDEEMPAEQRERFLENAAREIARLERLVTGLLSLARADQPPVRAPVDLKALLAEVAAARGVAFAGTAPTVQGDRAQLEAVVANLVENALRHGGTGVRVTIEGRPDGFAVVDDGGGISPANLPKVFDRFFTTDRGGGGTGLGLALVRAIVRRHGGDVGVESVPGRTAFTVRLP